MGCGPNIAVFMPLTGGIYFGGVLSGVARSANAVDGHAIAIQTLHAGHVNEDYVRDPRFDSMIGWDLVAGFIVVVHSVPERFLRAIVATGKPLVMVSHSVAGIDVPVVMPDNRSGMVEAVRHLISHGHTRIAFTGYTGQSDIRERFEAYEDTLREAGIEPDPDLYFAIEDNDERGGRVAARLLQAAGMPATAMVAAADLNALGLMEGLLAAGYVLPRDLAIVGFDDTAQASHVSPLLSTVRQDFSDVGALAADLIYAQLRGETVAPGRHDVPTSFVVRESCGCAGWRTAPEPADGPISAELFLPGRVSGAAATFAQSLAESVGEQALAAATARPLIADAVAQVSHLFDAAAAARDLPPINDVRNALGGVLRLSEKAEVAAAVIDGVRTYANTLTAELLAAPSAPGVLAADGPTAAQRIADAVVGVVWGVAQARQTIGYETETHLIDMLQRQYQVGMQLLRGIDSDARTLTWLAKTPTRAGALGLWTDGPDSPITIAGAYLRDGLPVDRTDGGAIPLTAFPPRFIFDGPSIPDEVVYAVPVRSTESDWGWLVTAGTIELLALAGWEVQNQWAALLTVALDEASAATKLQKVEREWHAILENTPDSIARYDTHLRYEYLNAAAAHALGRKPEDIVGYTDRELGRDEAVTIEWEAGLRQVLASGAPTQIEFSETVDNAVRWFQARAVPQLDSDDVIVGVLASSRDLTAVKNAELALAHQAVHDALTGLANRVLFVDRLTHSLTRLEREPNRIAVLFIDLDGFKGVNDTLGHEAGDTLLVDVAQRLRVASRRTDTVGRLGGDEFVVLCDKLSADEDVRIIGDRVVRALAEPFLVDGRALEISASIGIVMTSDPFTDAATLLRNADSAMYLAKERGGNRFQLFDPDLEKRATTRHSLEADLRQAVVRNELRLAYQPLFALDGGHVNGVEALLRWEHPERGLLMPGDFMSIAEQRGLIVPIGAWVLNEACRQLSEWSGDPHLGTVTMAVNVSGRQLAVPDFVTTVTDVLARHGVDPDRITLEITETTLIEEGANLRETLEAIVALGVHLALDDFGTGYSALAHLRDFPVDILKIDRSFVEQLGQGGRAHQIVGALTAMAHFLNMTVIGEGIETSQQWTELRNLNCDDGQGYLVCKPVPPDQLLALLRNINGGPAAETPSPTG